MVGRHNRPPKGVLKRGGRSANVRRTMRPAAAVDVGSNTVRLLIAEADDSTRLKTSLLERRVTRLSQGLEPGGRLDSQARDRTLAALEYFGRLVVEHGAGPVFGGATAAVRLAEDGLEFLDLVRRRSGLDIKRLAGEEEARLTALGILSGLDGLAGPVLALDPGGQSTEFVPIVGGEPRPGLSLNMGVVALTERFLKHDPPLAGELAELTEWVDGRLAEAGRFFAPRPELTLVGTAGTVTTIAAMLLELTDYDPERITGYRIGAGAVDELVDRLGKMPLADRRGLPGLEPGREDVILPGLIMTRRAMGYYNCREMLVVDAGLLEGLIIDGLT